MSGDCHDDYVAHALVTVRSGMVHRLDCVHIRAADVWHWQARNDGPGVAKACRKCLPEGLPEEGS